MLQDQATTLLPPHMWSSVTWSSLTDDQREGWMQRAREHLAACKTE